MNGLESLSIVLNSIIIPALGWGIKKLYELNGRISRIEGRLDGLNRHVNQLNDELHNNWLNKDKKGVE